MKKFVFIGAGSMAEALISGMIENGLVKGEQIWVTNRQNQNRLQQLKDQYGVNSSYQYEELFHGADAIVLAMKPKDAIHAIREFRSFLKADTLVISVLAGISIKTIADAAEQELPIVRAMPNTSAALGKSATALTTNSKVTEDQRLLVKHLFDTVGFTAFVQEEQLDAVTGLSGSGPAYIYYLVEAMEDSAMEIGLDKKLAKDLIIQTLVGAAAMMSASHKTPEQLRLEVTSPGGTTEAGIKILESHGVKDAFVSCIREAAAHSRRMGETLTKELKTSE